MTTTDRPPGKTTIAPGVLTTIVRLAALQVEGVMRTAQVPSSVNTLFSKSKDDGVSISIDDDGTVDVDIHLVLSGKVNLKDTSKSVQKEIALAISKMVGMEVGSINIHIEDVEYGESDPPGE